MHFRSMHRPVVGETGASYNFFEKSILDALFLSTHTFNLLFVLMKCTNDISYYS